MSKYTLNGTTYVSDNFGSAKALAMRKEKEKRERIEHMYAELEATNEKNYAIESIPFM